MRGILGGGHLPSDSTTHTMYVNFSKDFERDCSRFHYYDMGDID